MKIFSPNKIIAKSRFWYFLKKTQKLKNSRGEIISIEEIFEKNNCEIKNYGIWLRYESKSGVNNMFKEYRDVTVNSAVEQMYFELAGRQRARWNSIIILRVEELTAKECIRPQVKQFHDSRIKFPFTHSVQRDDVVHPLKFYKATRPRTSIKKKTNLKFMWI